MAVPQPGRCTLCLGCHRRAIKRAAPALQRIAFTSAMLLPTSLPALPPTCSPLEHQAATEHVHAVRHADHAVGPAARHMLPRPALVRPPKRDVQRVPPGLLCHVAHPEPAHLQGLRPMVCRDAGVFNAREVAAARTGVCWAVQRRRGCHRLLRPPASAQPLMSALPAGWPGRLCALCRWQARCSFGSSVSAATRLCIQAHTYFRDRALLVSAGGAAACRRPHCLRGPGLGPRCDAHGCIWH